MRDLIREKLKFPELQQLLAEAIKAGPRETIPSSLMERKGVEWHPKDWILFTKLPEEYVHRWVSHDIQLLMSEPVVRGHFIDLMPNIIRRLKPDDISRIKKRFGKELAELINMNGYSFMVFYKGKIEPATEKTVKALKFHPEDIRMYEDMMKCHYLKDPKTFLSFFADYAQKSIMKKKADITIGCNGTVSGSFDFVFMQGDPPTEGACHIHQNVVRMQFFESKSGKVRSVFYNHIDSSSFDKLKQESLEKIHKIEECSNPTCCVLMPQRCCELASYCSKECQIEDRPRHKKECTRTKSAKKEAESGQGGGEVGGDGPVEACASCMAPGPAYGCLETCCRLLYCDKRCRNAFFLSSGHKCARPAPKREDPCGAAGSF